jgi:transposase-like protein
MENEYKEPSLEKYNRRTHPNGFKMKILDELIRNKLSENQLSIRLGIPAGTLHTYKRKLLEQLGYFRILYSMKQKREKTDQKQDLEQENAKLKKALELAMLKVASLETIVDVAEEKYNISIRKKPGAKQSK